MFEEIGIKIKQQIVQWEQKFNVLTNEQVTISRNSQNRSVKEILGHLIDSASNNIHRVVHLQYQKPPVDFPNYATYGNNDRWISIQNYQEKDWNNLVQLWKYTNLHFLHVISNIHADKLDTVWNADENIQISLKEMITDFPRHFNLHLKEIEEMLEIPSDLP